MSTLDHLAENQLVSFVNQEIQGSERAEIEEHLEGCPKCYARYALLLELAVASVKKPPADFLKRLKLAVEEKAR